MQGSFLRFYVHQSLRHRHDMVWEWLLMQANKLGIRGGSAFKAIAGFGTHHKLTHERFFDLGGSDIIEVEFIVSDQEAAQLLDLMNREKVTAFYANIPARFGVIDPDAAEPPSITGG
jgi:uncharacterized protein